ncbi:MAG: lantibiotic dehydratase [Ktedonobacteraceae bacterium]
MQQSRTRFARAQQPATQAKSAARPLYELLNFVMVRAPLLPIEAYLALDAQLAQSEVASSSTHQAYFQSGSLAPRDPRIRWALAVGSSVLLDDLERSSPYSKDADHLKGKLLRFLIRMSTRPTPFGLFAGVALGQWGEMTDLALAVEPPHTRTRPDMTWLLTLVQEIESRLDVRNNLRFVTNPTAFIRGDRIFMTERSSIGESNSVSMVSVRASGVVKRALALAREPIPYQDLVDKLLLTTPGATPEKVEQLITGLWEQTVLLTDLRPPLTTDSPARYVVQRLSGIPAANEARTQLASILEAAATYDTLSPEEGVAAYRQLLAQANEVNKAVAETPVQVDMALALRSQYIAQAVGTEVARAAELLLRMTPSPDGLSYFKAYRTAFVSRYGQNREVPLLDLLDPNFGLGSPATYSGSNKGNAQAKAALRLQTLLDLATSALHDRQSVIELDEDTLKRLETWTPSPGTAPTSLDLNVFVAASSVEAIDAGKFQIIIGPNLGAQAAGRNLGRFANLIGPEAQEALKCAAHAEEAHTANKLLAELVYLPRQLRSANVVIRPAVRSHEIAIGVSPGVDTCKVIPLDELVVGIRDNRFYVRWLAEDTDIVITAGHMLNTMQAPAICRFLAELSRESAAQLSSFDWGPARSFPSLPRVQVGRVVLREAQWRIDTLTRGGLLPDSPRTFREALERWREHWQVPRYVYLSFGDNRLLLDLKSASQVEELRTEVRHLRDGGYLVLQEALPGPDQAWLQGPEGHYMTELVASLVLRHDPFQGTSVQKKQDKDVEESSNAPSHQGDPTPVLPAQTVLAVDRLRPPGSEWLFVKLYCPNVFEEDLIAYPLRIFAEEALASGLVEEWFFIRYNDPDLHLRLRFRGEPERLTGQLLPQLCTWATRLMEEGFCSRFVFDTYDREVERYGGTDGIEVAESIFAIDSRTVSKLIYIIQERVLKLDRITLAVLSADNLLASLGLTQAARLQWLRQHVTSRNEVGQEYRQKKKLLRSLLDDQSRLLNEPDGESVAQAFTTQSIMLAPIAERLLGLAEQGQLSQTMDMLFSSYIHMHFNRLFGSDHSAERRALGLLLRTREGLERSSVV